MATCLQLMKCFGFLLLSLQFLTPTVGQSAWIPTCGATASSPGQSWQFSTTTGYCGSSCPSGFATCGISSTCTVPCGSDCTYSFSNGLVCFPKYCTKYSYSCRRARFYCQGSYQIGGFGCYCPCALNGHGTCSTTSSQCICNDGWTGSNCQQCQPASGCLPGAGYCLNSINQNNQCICYPGNTG